MKKRKIKSAMNCEFTDHYFMDWLTWIGMPMLYDGALFVSRD